MVWINPSHIRVPTGVQVSVSEGKPMPSVEKQKEVRPTRIPEGTRLPATGYAWSLQSVSELSRGLSNLPT